MKKIILKIKYSAVAVFIVVTVVLSSCSEWLDVQPSNQTSADKLFKTELGFQEALTGVYTLMSNKDLYGKEMTYGFVDVIAQQWQLTSVASSSPYLGAKIYDFETELTYSLIEKIWLAQYNAIANVNDILAFVDNRKAVFDSEDGYSFLKGEALALRAFLHFDLLRLYAPNDFVLGKSTKYIPYVSEFSKNLSESFTAKEIAEKCLKDLNQAEELLKNDPILSGIPSPNVYYKNRVYHMNYYAVQAIKARIYFYMGQKKRAYDAAKIVIESQNNTRFRWVKESEATSSTELGMDYTYSSEHIFCLNIRKLEDYIVGSFETPYDVQLKNRKHNESLKTLFDGNEYRAYLYDKDVLFIKFNQVDKSVTRDKMPVIKISEMYYIAAECATDPTEALGYLNLVRQNRRISGTIDNYSQLASELFKEYQKEFTGEGQLFYYYKRTNQRIESSSDSYSFVLPLPRVELDLGGRPRPETI